VSAFLEHCSIEWNLLTLREENGVSAVVALNKTHDLLRGVKVANPDLFKECVLNQSKGDVCVAGQSIDRQGQLSFERQGRSKLKVMELFKFTKPLRDIFGNVRGQCGEYLTGAEVRCRYVVLHYARLTVVTVSTMLSICFDEIFFVHKGSGCDDDVFEEPGLLECSGSSGDHCTCR